MVPICWSHKLLFHNFLAKHVQPGFVARCLDADDYINYISIAIIKSLVLITISSIIQ